MDILQYVYPFISWWMFELCIQFLPTINAAVNISVQSFIWRYFQVTMGIWNQILPNSIVPSTTKLHALKYLNFIHRRMVAGAVSVLPISSDLVSIFLLTGIPNIQQMCLCWRAALGLLEHTLPALKESQTCLEIYISPTAALNQWLVR